MSEIFENAITSIRLGIEDFETGSDDRMLSAARNYYAGLLLLAKECLLQAAPKASAMEVIGAKFKPIPDGQGAVVHEIIGYATVDLNQLRQRFNDFELPWPQADIKKLQRFRNDLEHLHLKDSVSALSEAIASSFPMVLDFFEILKDDPKEYLRDVWDTVLEQREAFEKVQKQCIDTLEKVDWPAEVSNLDRMSCPECSSSLIGQFDPSNTDSENVIGSCSQCEHEISNEKIIEMIVETSYAADVYIAFKEGGGDSIEACPNCTVVAYVETSEASVCFACGESVAGECIRCSGGINIHEYDNDQPDLCSYCAHQYEKLMRE